MRKRIACGLAAALLLTAFWSVSAFAASKKDDKIKVTRVEMNTDAITVRVNQTRTLWATVRPYDADDQVLYWASSDEEIVVVDGDGKITGISPGKAEITATSHNDKVGRCQVTVSGTVVKAIEEDVENTQQPDATLSGGETLSAATIRLEVENAVKSAAGGKATVTYRDKTTVSLAALRAAAYTAGYHGGEATLRFITTQDGLGREPDSFSGKETSPIQGWLEIKPERAGEEDGSVGLAVYTAGDKIAQGKQQADKLLGDTAQVVRLSQTGAFNMEVTVAAKVDLSTLNTSSLYLYRYNTEAGSFERLNGKNYTVDSDGYVRFSVSTGGVYAVWDN